MNRSFQPYQYIFDGDTPRRATLRLIYYTGVLGPGLQGMVMGLERVQFTELTDCVLLSAVSYLKRDNARLLQSCQDRPNKLELRFDHAQMMPTTYRLLALEFFLNQLPSGDYALYTYTCAKLPMALGMMQDMSDLAVPYTTHNSEYVLFSALERKAVHDYRAAMHLPPIAVEAVPYVEAAPAWPDMTTPLVETPVERHEAIQGYQCG